MTTDSALPEDWQAVAEAESDPEGLNDPGEVDASFAGCEYVADCGRPSGHGGKHYHIDGLWRRVAAPEGLDVERLGFDALLDIGQAILDRAYPPHPLLCSHDPRADIGARTTAAVADLIASCRRLSHD